MTRLIIEEGLEGEAGDAVGRDYYEHGAQAGQGYRNGYRTGRLRTAEGAIEYSAPQVAGREEPYRSAIREHLKDDLSGKLELLCGQPLHIRSYSGQIAARPSLAFYKAKPNRIGEHGNDDGNRCRNYLLDHNRLGSCRCDKIAFPAS